MSNIKLVPWHMADPADATFNRLDVDAPDEDLTYATVGFQLDEERQEVTLVVDPDQVSATVKTWGHGANSYEYGEEYQLVRKSQLLELGKAIDDLDAGRNGHASARLHTLFDSITKED